MRREISAITDITTRPAINVCDRGAKGDGASDSMAFAIAISEAIGENGTLLIPPPQSGAYYNLDTAQVIEPPSGTQAYLDIEAHVPPGGIRWTGSSNASVFTIRGLKNAHIIGLQVIIGTQSNVRVFDVVQSAAFPSCANVTWEKCLVNLGTGRSNVGWRWGADAGGYDISRHQFLNCAAFSGDMSNTHGHTAWLNLNANALNCGWNTSYGAYLQWLYRASSLLTALNGAIDDTVTSITVDDTTGFEPTGRIKINSEELDYTGITGNQFTGCSRGAGGTAAASHLDNSVVYQGVYDPFAETWSFDRIGGANHSFENVGGSFNNVAFLTRTGALTVHGGRHEHSQRLLQAGYTQSGEIEFSAIGVTHQVDSLPSDGIIAAIGAPGVFTFDSCRFTGVNHGAAMFTAGAFDSWAGPIGTPGGFGSLAVRNSAIRGAAPTVWTLPVTWRRPDVAGSMYMNSSSQPLGWVTGAASSGELISDDNGDSAKTIHAQIDEQTQRWATEITADRAVTLSTTGAVNGSRFHIVREASATGAFPLNVGTGPLKALAVGQWCDVVYDGSAWTLVAFGSL